MGNCAHAEGKYDPTIAISVESFEILYPIGRGGFGKVWRVSHKQSLEQYAMKEMKKDLVLSRNFASLIMNERRLLGVLSHEFIVNLHYAFQSNLSLYLVVDLMSGGDLRFYLVNHGRIPEESLKFLAGCIILGLEYLHSNQIVHRDIKPENLVFDKQGYLHITDFGIAKKANTDNTGIISGTPGYMAPEVICGQDHGVEADYFALGVILYESIFLKRPYLGSNRKEIRDGILNRQAKVICEDQVCSESGRDFINKLLQRKPQNRLSFEEIQKHPWIKDSDWEGLLKSELKSPFAPTKEDNFDVLLVNDALEKATGRATKADRVKQFAGYSYDSSLLKLVK